MQIAIGRSTLTLLTGDITTRRVDAVVNAANGRLAGGGGVDGAIHRAGGPAIMRETAEKFPDGCETGSAVATTAGELPARFVFHAVGPVWHGGYRDEERQLRSCYRTCLALAVERDCGSIAFPAISCGVYGYPLDLAAAAAVGETAEVLSSSPPLAVEFVLFHEGVYAAFQRAAERATASRA